MLNYYFRDSIKSFVKKDASEIMGEISISDKFDSRQTQSRAWIAEIEVLQLALAEFIGEIFFEFSIPRLGKRVDVLIIINDIVFVVEFKVGESKYLRYDIDQVWDYALDLKYFHQPSHEIVLAPVLVATEAKQSYIEITTTSHHDNLLVPIKTNERDLHQVIAKTLDFFGENEKIDCEHLAFGISIY